MTYLDIFPVPVEGDAVVVLGLVYGMIGIGVIGSSRMECTAVSPAVNMAAGPCAQAKDVEVLLDARTAELAGQPGLETRGTLAVKGVGDVPHYAAAHDVA